MRAYQHRCAICALRERSLVQAAHIVPDIEPEGVAAVVNGLALCAIHRLAFDRNVLGIDPDGVVHIARRLLDETGGPTHRLAGLPRRRHLAAPPTSGPPGPGSDRLRTLPPSSHPMGSSHVLRSTPCLPIASPIRTRSRRA
jgi:putative restriction endonuclease